MHNWMLTFWRGGHNWLCKAGGDGTIYSAVVTCVREKWYRTIKYRFYCRLLYSRPVVLEKVSSIYGIVIPSSTADCISQKSFGISRVKTSFLCYLLGAQCVFNQPCSCLPSANAPASIDTSWLITSSVWQWRGGKYRLYHRTQYSDANNGHDGVSNHQPQGCLLNRLFRRRSKKTSKLRVTGLCEGNSPVTGEFPAQRASDAKNVSNW